MLVQARADWPSMPKSSTRNSVIRSSIRPDAAIRGIKGVVEVEDPGRDMAKASPKRLVGRQAKAAGGIRGAMDTPVSSDKIELRHDMRHLPRLAANHVLSITIDLRAVTFASAACSTAFRIIARESRRANRIRIDPGTACRGVAFELRSINGERQRKMGEDLFDFAGQSAPSARRPEQRPANRFARAFRRPERPWQLERRGQKTVRGPAAREEGAVGTTGKEHSALPPRSRLRLGAPRIILRDPGLERRAVFARAGRRPQVGVTGAADVAPMSISA